MGRPQGEIVAVSQTRNNAYPDAPPYNPPQRFPEYPFGDDLWDPSNSVYGAVRDLLRKLKLDEDDYGTATWNPMGDFIAPGEKVLIKPNFVIHQPAEGPELSCIVTHPAVIRPIVDYAFLAAGPTGEVIIADTPLESCDFSAIDERLGLTEMVNFLAKDHGIPLKSVDLREQWLQVTGDGTIKSRTLAGDPLGYVEVELDSHSAFSALDPEPQNYYTLGDHTVDHADPWESRKGMPNAYHNSSTHRYPVSRTVLGSDTIISVPKLKTHKKAGVTLSMKNMIGIVRNKDSMPHYRPGPPPRGDAFAEYPSRLFLRRRKLKQRLRGARVLDKTFVPVARGIHNLLRLPKGIQPIEWGDWHGNDTLWRTIVDLNRIVLYADKNGTMQRRQQRKYLAIVDGIVGQEGEGPMGGRPKRCGILMAGFHPVLVDTVGAKIMGFEPRKIPAIEKASGLSEYPLCSCGFDDIQIVGIGESNVLDLEFEPPRGWRGHIEGREEPGF